MGGRAGGDHIGMKAFKSLKPAVPEASDFIKGYELINDPFCLSRFEFPSPIITTTDLGLRCISASYLTLRSTLSFPSAYTLSYYPVVLGQSLPISMKPSHKAQRGSGLLAD